MNTYGRKPANSILIISYETFRLHAHMLHTSEVGLRLPFFTMSKEHTDPIISY